MITLHADQKARYIRTGLICYECLLVIDFKATGKRRLCESCWVSHQ